MQEYSLRQRIYDARRWILMKMRRFKQQLSREEAVAIVKANRTGVLSLVDAEGMPYGVPLNYAYHDNRLLFHCARSGRKLEAILQHGCASFCIIHQDKVVLERFANDFVSVIISGPIRRVAAEKQRTAIEDFMAFYADRDYPGLQREIDTYMSGLVMLEMELQEISGKEGRYLMEKRSLEG